MIKQHVKVLVVEDQELWCHQFFGEVLEDLGYVVFPAPTKEKAIELLDQYRFDLAIIDINLTAITGNTDGLLVVDYLRSKDTDLPIIVVSGTDGDFRSLREQGYIIFAEISKELFDLEQFMAQVQKAVNRED